MNSKILLLTFLLLAASGCDFFSKTRDPLVVKLTIKHGDKVLLSKEENMKWNDNSELEVSPYHFNFNLTQLDNREIILKTEALKNQENWGIGTSYLRYNHQSEVIFQHSGEEISVLLFPIKEVKK